MFELGNQISILNEFSNYWTIALLVFARSIAFVSIAPLTGHKSNPVLVKICFAILLTLMIFPNLQTPSVYPKNHLFIFQIVMNVMVGLLVGWVATLMLEIARAAGEMINMQMSLQAANLFDPGSQTQTTIIGRFFEMMAMVIFITVGGMEKVIEGLSLSYQQFPIILYSIDLNLPKMLSATSSVLGLGFLIVSPIVMILLVIDLILGLMSRAAPQINAFQISFSIKPTLGVILLLLLLPALFPIFAGLFSNPLKFLY